MEEHDLSRSEVGYENTELMKSLESEKQNLNVNTVLIQEPVKLLEVRKNVFY